MVNNQNSSPRQNQRFGFRSIVSGIIILALGTAIYVGASFRNQEPDFYAPGRTAIVNARMHIEELLGYKQALIAQQRLVHDELNQAISQLVEAETLDPADRSKIEEMKAKLMAIEEADNIQQNSHDNLQTQYDELLAQMNRLINKLENHRK